ncbi:cytochrome P450 [Trichoderma austrokoningii]
MFATFIIGIFALVLFIIYHRFFQKKDVLLSLPPGPKPLPIIGNLLDLPPAGTPEFQHWLKFKDLYGPLSSVTVLGQTMVIIHDREAAYEVMNKTSLKTSSRPKTVFAYELCGFEKFTSGRSYDATFRLHRKLMHQQAGTRLLAARFNKVQDVESRHLLQRILDDPENLFKHFKTEAGAIILKIVYGYSIDPHAADPLVELVDKMMKNFSIAMTPMGNLVDIIPALQHLPSGFPGTGFKNTAQKMKKVNLDTVNIPYTFVEQQMANGKHRSSFVSGLIERYSTNKSNNVTMDNDIEDAIKSTAAILYGGGADTSASALSAFTLAMILFPEVQKKAQEEIDDIIGTNPNRLPQFEDQEQLPYVSAVVKELMRWFSVLPIPTPHMSDEEVIYGGYRIPKGSFLLPSSWWFHHDPKTYPNPDSFSPERFLEPRNEPDPSEAFGWGRRICPGRYISNDNLFITIARLLATFNITKKTDEEGRLIVPKIKYSPGLVSHPEEFLYAVTVRSQKHEELIRSAEVEYPWEKSDSGFLVFDRDQQPADGNTECLSVQ